MRTAMLHGQILLTTLTELPSEVFMPMSQSTLISHSDMYLKYWFTKSENGWVNQRKNTLAVQALCNQLEIPCVIKNADQEMSGTKEQLEYARDYMHAGPLGHKRLAEKILNDYNKIK
jgi:hypothetical protein